MFRRPLPLQILLVHHLAECEQTVICTAVLVDGFERVLEDGVELRIAGNVLARLRARLAAVLVVQQAIVIPPTRSR